MFLPNLGLWKEDRNILDALLQMAQQLLQCDIKQENQEVLQNFKEKIKLKINSREK